MLKPLRICSLLPSSTEILFALGLGDAIVAVTHECDYPEEAKHKPKVTSSDISAILPGAEIDSRVRQQLEDTGSLYSLDSELLDALEPDIIFTQQLCTVCAVSYENVFRVAARLSSKPRVINVEPKSLEDILQSILHIGRLTHVESRAEELVEQLRRTMESIRRKTDTVQRRSMLFLEWLDPPFCAGHWIPEVIEFAGGTDPLARKHEPSTQISLASIVESDPAVLVISCCGFSVERTMSELHLLANPLLKNLRAMKNGNVIVVDGSSYFSRPGPRIVDSLKILASVLHPEIVRFECPETVVRRLTIQEYDQTMCRTTNRKALRS